MGKINVVVSGDKRIDVVTEGRVGQRGLRGFSAYEVAVQNGFVGTEAEWLETLKGGTFVHNQMIPDSVWTINHNLDYYPNVISFDTAGTQILGEIVHTSTNTLVITFSHPSGGKAYLS